MSLVIRDMEIKSTMYHFTCVRMVIINKSTNSKCWRGRGERGSFLHCWWDCSLVQPLWKAVWRYLRKLKMGLPYDPAIPHLVIQLKKPKTLEVFSDFLRSCKFYLSNLPRLTSFLRWSWEQHHALRLWADVLWQYVNARSCFLSYLGCFLKCQYL